MAHTCTLLITLLFSGVAAIFMIVAAIGWDDQQDCTNLVHTAWATLDGESSLVTVSGGFKLGLRGIALDLTDGVNVDDKCVFYEWASFPALVDDWTIASTISDCEKFGKGAMGCVLISLFFLCTGLVFNLTRCCSGASCLRACSITLPLLAALFAIAACGLFHAKCVEPVSDLFDNVGIGTFKPYVGEAACICAALLASVVSCCHGCTKRSRDNERTVVLLR